MTTVNTRHILFICGGAFPGLENVIKRRLTKHGHIGFESQLKDDLDKDENILSKVETEDIRSYGLIPEFIGRLPIVFALQQMDEKLLVKVLKEPKNAIVKQYKKLFAMDGVKLDFDEDALLEIAHRAVEKKTGARALRSILEETMLDIMYQIPKDDMIGHVTITQDYVKGVGGPRIEVRD
jgi:ATP-dependent Clp protease ATP-binding subunit ClpX